MQRHELLDELAHGIVDWAADQGLFTSCLNCSHWTGEAPTNGEPPEACRLFKARPPARIIVTGCPDHTDNIPF